MAVLRPGPGENWSPPSEPLPLLRGRKAAVLRRHWALASGGGQAGRGEGPERTLCDGASLSPLPILPAVLWVQLAALLTLTASTGQQAPAQPQAHYSLPTMPTDGTVRGAAGGGGGDPAATQQQHAADRQWEEQQQQQQQQRGSSVCVCADCRPAAARPPRAGAAAALCGRVAARAAGKHERGPTAA